MATPETPDVLSTPSTARATSEFAPTISFPPVTKAEDAEGSISIDQDPLPAAVTVPSSVDKSVCANNLMLEPASAVPEMRATVGFTVATVEIIGTEGGIVSTTKVVSELAPGVPPTVFTAYTVFEPSCKIGSCALQAPFWSARTVAKSSSLESS